MDVTVNEKNISRVLLNVISPRSEEHIVRFDALQSEDMLVTLD